MAINTLELPTWDPIKLFHFSWIKGMFHIIILFTWICHFILFYFIFYDLFYCFPFILLWRPVYLSLFFCCFELISGIANILWHYMKDYWGESRSVADVTLKWTGKRGWVMKPHLVTRGLLFCCCGWSLPVLSAHKRDYFIRVQASIGSVTAVFFTLCPLLLHLSLHLFFPRSLCSLHPRPQTAWLNTQANVSLFKETQVVDMLAMGQDQNEELL